MTSSKRICIFRKRLSLAIMLIMLLPLPAGAASYRTLVVSDDEGIASLILSSLSLLSGEVTAPAAIEEYGRKAADEERIAREAAISGYITSEDLSGLESYLAQEEAAGAAADDGSLVLEVVEAEVQDAERPFLLAGDRDAFDYIRLVQDLDLI